MALPIHALKLLAPYLRNAKVLCLGYPDILCTSAWVKKTFDVEITQFTQNGHRHNVDYELPESEHFFEILGSELTCIDFASDMGFERIANLNFHHEFGDFDLVIVPGTLEHCFNIGTAWQNAFDSVKVGGVIFHLSPMTMVNHGFFNFNPTLFHDFYKQNNWEILDLGVIPNNQPRVEAVKRFTAHIEFLIRCLAQRKSQGQMVFPLQTKYLEALQEAA